MSSAGSRRKTIPPCLRSRSSMRVVELSSTSASTAALPGVSACTTSSRNFGPSLLMSRSNRKPVKPGSAYGEARRPPQHFEQLAREQPEGGAKGGSPFLRGLPDADLPCLVLDDHRVSIKRNIAIPVQVPQGTQSIECRGVAIENCNQHLVH